MNDLLKKAKYNHGLLHKHEPGFTSNRQVSVPVDKIDEMARKFLTARQARAV